MKTVFYTGCDQKSWSGIGQSNLWRLSLILIADGGAVDLGHEVFFDDFDGSTSNESRRENPLAAGKK